MAYVHGSGLTGVHLYKAPDRTVKRLASHSHKQRKSAASASPRTGPSPSTAAGGAFPDPLANSVVRDGPPRQPHDWRLSLDQLRALKSSSLENVDGSDLDVIVAVQFDIVAALRAAIEARTLLCTVEDVNAALASWSLASDGGPIRQTAMTLLTLTLSAQWLVKGRTAMFRVLYILGGEHLTTLRWVKNWTPWSRKPPRRRTTCAFTLRASCKTRIPRTMTLRVPVALATISRRSARGEDRTWFGL